MESALRIGQLEGYRVLLGESGVARTQLVLVTRYPEHYSPGDMHPDLELRWYELADWFENEMPTLEALGPLPAFLVQQFLDFLRARGMTLTQVGKYMPDGLRALGNLLNMLFEAAAACKVSARISADRDSTGIALDGVKYWLGINYAEPEKLWFGTRTRIDPEAAAKLGVGEITQENWVPGRYRWWLGVELDSEGIHFYSRTKVGQMEWVEKFLRDCLAKARAIETPDQPPIPEESEGK